MLILTRRVGEKLIFEGTGIEIVVLSIRGSQARLGITAPKEIDVYRDEIYVRELKKRALKASEESKAEYILDGIVEEERVDGSK